MILLLLAFNVQGRKKKQEPSLAPKRHSEHVHMADHSGHSCRIADHGGYVCTNLLTSHQPHESNYLTGSHLEVPHLLTYLHSNHLHSLTI
jgi:hypothetical protein